MNKDRHLSTFWTFAILLLSTFVLGFFFHFHKDWPNPNETVRLYLSLAIADSGRLNIDREIDKYGVIWDRAVYNGRIYSDKAPGISFAASIPIFVSKVVYKTLLHKEPPLKTYYVIAVIFTSLLATIVALFFLIKLLSLYNLSFFSTLLAVLALILCTYANTYSMLFFGHAFSSALLFIAFVLIEFYIKQDRKPAYVMIAAFLASYAFISEYPTIFISLMLLVYLFISTREKKIFLFSAAALIPLLLLIYYQYKCFGKPFSTGYEHLDSETFSRIHKEGLLGFKYPNPKALVNLLFGSQRGLFFFSPVLLLAIYMFFKDRLRGQLTKLTSAIFVFYTLLISSFGYWIGGDAAGARHLLPLNFFLIIPLSFALEEIKNRKFMLSLFFGLLVISGLNIISSTVSWPFFPPQFLNPLADFCGIMIKEGFITHSIIGSLFNIRGFDSLGIYLLPIAVVVILAMVFSLKNYHWGYVIVAEMLTLWVLFLSLLFPTKPDEGNFREIIRIEKAFDPKTKLEIPFANYPKNEDYVCIKRGNMLVRSGETIGAIKEYRCSK